MESVKPVYPLYACERCGEQKPGKKAKNDGHGPPQNWKRVQGSLMCKSCCDSSFAIAAVSLRLARPVPSEASKALTEQQKQKLQKDEWDLFNKALRFALGETTRIGNWTIREIMRCEPPLLHGGTDRPKVVKPNLYATYKEFRQSFPSKAALSAITRAQSMYAASRKRHGQNPSIRSMPFAIEPPKNLWRAVSVDGREITVDVTLPLSATKTREFKLRLKCDPKNTRPLETLKRMIAGEVECREISVLESGKHTMVKFTGYFPVEHNPHTNILRVQSTDDTFCQIINAKSMRLYALNADLAKQWIGEHSRLMQRLGDDRKFERRTGRSKEKFERHVTWLCERHANRMRSYMQMQAAQIANWAERQKANCVTWIDWPDTQSHPNVTAFEQFPWAAFLGILTSTLKQKDITLIRHGVASGSVPQESMEPLE